MVFLKLSALLSLALLVSGAPSAVWSDFTVRHALAEVPRGWEIHSRAPADHIINLSIALTQGRVDDLIRTLYEVSDPTKDTYGKHLSKE